MRTPGGGGASAGNTIPSRSIAGKHTGVLGGRTASTSETLTRSERSRRGLTLVARRAEPSGDDRDTAHTPPPPRQTRWIARLDLEQRRQKASTSARRRHRRRRQRRRRPASIASIAPTTYAAVARARGDRSAAAVGHRARQQAVNANRAENQCQRRARDRHPERKAPLRELPRIAANYGRALVSGRSDRAIRRRRSAGIAPPVRRSFAPAAIAKSSTAVGCRCAHGR